MPQPALHLLLGRQQLARWSETGRAPFDVHDAAASNAFLHGTLAPDMGNFPGGDSALAHAVHTRRTGDVVRALFDAAVTRAETAFAWGWLSHVLADAWIHPLVNAAAAAHAHDGRATLREHVRVEVGLDVRLCCVDPALEGVRLRRAFDREGYRFLARVLTDHVGVTVDGAQLARMERGLVLFSHAALDFARGGARVLCWSESAPRPALPAAVVWHAATRLSPRTSMVHAYLNPRVPDAALLGAVDRAIERVHADFAACERRGVDNLPSWNLEDGSVAGDARHVA
jgi:hypothetical protein